MTRVLIVEDDLHLARVMEDWLLSDGYEVTVVDNGQGASDRLGSEDFDLIIMDWTLPGLAGVEVLRRYRESGGKASILMLTGRDKIQDKEEGFDAGADDYLTKPFHPRELSARLKALARRPREMKDGIVKARNIILDPDGKTVTKDGVPVTLLPKEFALLEFLMRHPNKVFSADTLLDKVWSKDSENSPDTVRVHITKLRSKIDTEGMPSLIRTLHRVGYKLEL